jgi:hypothetical protein
VELTPSERKDSGSTQKSSPDVPPNPARDTTADLRGKNTKRSSAGKPCGRTFCATTNIFSRDPRLAPTAARRAVISSGSTSFRSRFASMNVAPRAARCEIKLHAAWILHCETLPPFRRNNRRTFLSLFQSPPDFPKPPAENQSSNILVGATGFEPTTSCSQSKRSSQSELRPEKFIINMLREISPISPIV